MKKTQNKTKKKTKLISAELFNSFQDREQFLESLTSEKDIVHKICSQSIMMVMLSCVYGIVMGSHNGLLQAISSGIKVPLFLTLTLLVCFPVFFIIQSVLGSKMGLLQMLNVLIAGFFMVTLIMAAFSPIVAFFLITSDSYPFIKLLHVVIFSIAGFFGMKTMHEALQFACEKKKVYPKVGVVVFRFWIVVLAFVGMQLAWNLRPFIGSKSLKFEVFRAREGNFYLALIHSVRDLAESDD